MWTPFVTGNTCEDVLYDDAPYDATHMIRLCNFVKGSDQILDSHRSWLETYVKAGMAAENSWFDLVGYASELPYNPDDKTGGNWALSNRRCAAVRQVMERIMIDQNSNRGITFHVVMGVGDSHSDPDPTPDHNHGFFRAVVVKIFAPAQKVEVKQQLRHGYTTVDATRFEFEPVEIAGAGMSRFGADWLYFGIHDLDNRRRRYFAHIGGSGSPDLPFMPSISFSAQHSGPAIPFRSNPWGVLELEDFEGPSFLIQAIGATLGTRSIGGDMRLKWHPKAWTDHDYHALLDIPFSLSSGFGVSAGSAGAGRVIIMPTSFKPTFYSR